MCVNFLHAKFINYAIDTEYLKLMDFAELSQEEYFDCYEDKDYDKILSQFEREMEDEHYRGSDEDYWWYHVRQEDNAKYIKHFLIVLAVTPVWSSSLFHKDTQPEFFGFCPFHKNFLPYFFFPFRPNLPYPQGEGLLPPYPPLGHQPRDLLSMPILASIFDYTLITFLPPNVPKVDPKTSQNGFQNRSQNKANINVGNIRKIM